LAIAFEAIGMTGIYIRKVTGIVGSAGVGGPISSH